MAKLTHDEFLSQLGQLYRDSKESGSVYITFKRQTRVKESGTSKRKGADGENFCLVRARLGPKKIRTEVMPRDVGRFQSSLAQVYRAEMTGLLKKQEVKTAKKKKKTHLQ